MLEGFSKVLWLRRQLEHRNYYNFGLEVTLEQPLYLLVRIEYT
jgi:hypothetical protein